MWLRCASCAHQWPYLRFEISCPHCGGDWLEVGYNLNMVRRRWEQMLRKRPFTMWRYRELLPVRKDAYIVTMDEGGTPLLRAENLGLMLGRPRLYIKDERQNPTGSFKDRQASLAISVAREAGLREMVVASTGNVAISYAAYCARAGIQLWAFLVSSAPSDKMREVALYGAEVIKVTGTYDQTKRVAAQFAERRGLFLDRGIRSLAARESMKTIAFEIAEQLGWRSPDWYIQAVSGGMGPIGVWKGFRELQEMGLVDRIPRIGVIQAEGCAPIVQSFREGLEQARVIQTPRTRVATLATGDPGPAYPVLRRIVLETGGAMETVSDEETYRAMHLLAKVEGLSMEPAAAAAFAGAFRLIASGHIRPEETVVINASGHTFPVEKFALGEGWLYTMEAPQTVSEGFLTALDQLDPRGRRVLIVDDDPDAARLIRRILQARGIFYVEEAYRGDEALDRIRRQPPDVILLDLMMPGMDGFAVLEALKADETLRQIPVLVVTARSLAPEERSRLREQAYAVLEKGTFTDEDLIEDMLAALRTS
ncbi:MAG: threonine synthase [Anaerolineae bacterium]|nr:threonine synthase [Thermoflexus sp.]MDW8064582.1 threonine synthase [Anaerolineae bacterium]